MKCAIMQPTFLPWSGYFSLMDQVDVFVFLDDVQLEKRSWQMRNRIIVNGAELLITVPLMRCSQSTKIYEAIIYSDRSWAKKLLVTLQHSYGKTPYKDAIFDVLTLESLTRHSSLADLNIYLIKEICALIGLDVKTERSQNIAATGKRSEKLLNICQNLSCDTYISPEGSRQYLEADNLFNSEGVALKFHTYSQIPYEQIGTRGFVPFMSIIDLIANLGPQNTISYLRAGI